MASIDWNEALHLGEETVDSDHQETIAALNRLQKLLSETPEALGPALDDFIEHGRKHFAYEESLMLKHEFPVTDIHKAEHERVLLWMEGQRALLLRDGPEALDHFIKVELPDWLTLHLHTMDAALIGYIRQVSTK